MTLFRKIFLLNIFLFSITAGFCESAIDVRDRAMELSTVQESIDHVLLSIKSVESASGKRSLWCLAGRLQELSFDWNGAAKSYVQAARISGNNDAGFESISVDELRLCAARCFLNCGDYENAKISLNSFINSSKDEKLGAISNMYLVWVSLVQASSKTEISDCMDRLKSYLEMDSMKSVRASVLFSLWYLNGESKYFDLLKKDFSSSPEYFIASGKTQLSADPFWYFVYRNVEEKSLASSTPAKKNESAEKKSTETKPAETKPAEQKTVSAEKKTAEVKPTESKTSSEKKSVTENKAEVKSSGAKLGREQLGLFRNKENADALVSRAKDKGFAAYYFTETRASGTTYYIVVVDENAEGTMGKKLRAAGFDCYPVE